MEINRNKVIRRVIRRVIAKVTFKITIKCPALASAAENIICFMYYHVMKSALLRNTSLLAARQLLDNA